MNGNNRKNANIPPRAASPSARGGNATRRTEGSTGPTVKREEGTRPSGQQPRPNGAPNGQRGGQNRGEARPGNDGGHRRESVILLRVLFIAGAAFGAALVVWLLLLLVPIREITVSGESYYTAEELSEALGVEEGGRMYGFRKHRAVKALREELPLLRDVKVKRSLKGTLTLVPKETTASFFVKVSGNYYLLSREDFRVLLEAEDKERLTAYGYYEISLPDVRVAFIGELLEFGKEGRTGYITTLLDKLDASYLYGRITGIRASSQFDLSIIVDGKYNIYLKEIEELDRKLATLEWLIEEPAFQGDAQVEVNISDVARPSIRVVDAIDSEIR